VLTRDPGETGAVAVVVAGASCAVAGLAGLVALALEESSAARSRPRRREPRRGRALRRALGLGAVVAALGILRAVDGLTVLTGSFIVAGFVLAELVLTRSARPAMRSG
jgi:hypothetical protein